MIKSIRDISALFAIKDQYDNLSAKEKQIADFILEHPRESVNPSIEELAERIGISESTMVRFARKLGYSGYQRFRIALARETIPSTSQLFERDVIDAADGFDAVFTSAITSLIETQKILDRSLIMSVATMMANARNVYLLGLGGSNIVAEDALHKLVRTGITCQWAADFHLQLMMASQGSNEDVALLISHTGSGYDSLALAEELKANDVPLVVLTTNARSPLARLADYVLAVKAGSSMTVAESFSARIVDLAIIDLLYLQVMEVLKEKGIEQLNKMRASIAKRRV